MRFQDKLRSYAILVAVNLIATAAFVVLALTPYRTVGYLLVAGALTAIATRGRKSGFGETITAQALVGAAIFTDTYRAHPSRPVAGLAVAAGLYALLLLNQPVLDFLVTRPQAKVANLPGYAPKRATIVSPRRLYAGNIAILVLAAACALAGVTAWLVAAVALVAGGLAALVGAQAIRQRLYQDATDRPLRAAIEAYDPRFAMYFSAPDNTEYHVTMWLPYLVRIGKPFVIIVREPRSFGPLAKMAGAVGVPVIYAPGVTQVDLVVTDRMKACFYVNNAALNSHMVRFAHMTHIQLLHGDSDKAASANQVTAMFNKIFVAGQAGIDRYAANGVLIPAEKFDIVGRPQVETIEVARDARKATIALYATTWIGLYTDSRYCSLPIGERIVRHLLDRGLTVIMRPHPYSARHPESALHSTRLEQMLAEDRAKTGRQHVYGAAATTEMSLIDCINAADVLISDVSSVASDWLYSEKPFALTNMVDKAPAEFEAAFPLARAAYVIDSEAADMAAVLDEMLGDDPIAATRRKIKTYYLGDFDADAYADGFVLAAASYTG